MLNELYLFMCSLFFISDSLNILPITLWNKANEISKLPCRTEDKRMGTEGKGQTLTLPIATLT